MLKIDLLISNPCYSSPISHPLDAFNAMGHLVVSPPLQVNETELTLEHVMQHLVIIGKNVNCRQKL